MDHLVGRAGGVIGRPHPGDLAQLRGSDRSEAAGEDIAVLVDDIHRVTADEGPLDKKTQHLIKIGVPNGPPNQTSQKKVTLESCLSTLEVTKCPSGASDSGGNKRTVQFMFTKVLNDLSKSVQVSDTQVALLLSP